MVAEVSYPACLATLYDDVGGVFIVWGTESSLQNPQEPEKISRVCDRLYDLPGDLVLITKPGELKQPAVYKAVA